MTCKTKSLIGKISFAAVMVIGCAVVGGCVGLLYGAMCRVQLERSLASQGVQIKLEHPNLGEVGAEMGLTGGVLTSALFVWVMIALHRRFAGWKLIGLGTLTGMATGSVCAAITHVGVAAAVLANGTYFGGNLAIPLISLGAMISGAIVGIPMGAIGGRLADVPRPEVSNEYLGAAIPPHSPQAV